MRILALGLGPLNHGDELPGLGKTRQHRSLAVELAPEQIAGDCYPDPVGGGQRLGPAQSGIIQSTWTTGDDDGAVGIELDEGGADVMEPAQRLEADCPGMAEHD